MKEVAITREKLAIDFRPLALAQPAVVEATYHLYNPGAVKRLDLLFVAGSEEVSDFEVRLGDRPLKSERVPEDELHRRWEETPKNWRSARDLPGIDGAVESRISPQAPYAGVALLTFTLELPPGRSTLRARYRTKVAGGEEEGYPTATWQLPYVLAPARQWRSFGGLDVTVHLPDGWQHACTPALEREGDVLRGSFDGLPADALVVSARMPAGPWPQRWIYLYAGLTFLAFVGGGALCWGSGRWLGRSLAWGREHRGWGEVTLCGSILVTALFLGLLWGVLLFASWRVAVWTIDAALGEQQSPYFIRNLVGTSGYTLLLMLIAVPCGWCLTWKSASSWLKAAPQRPATPRDDNGGH